MPVVERESHAFTDLPTELDQYFEEREIVIHVVPTDLMQGIDKRCCDFKITSAKQYQDYLNQELEFWTTNDPNQSLRMFSDVERIKNALRHFENAINHANNKSVYNYKQEMNNSVTLIAEHWLYSKTTIAKFLIEKCAGKTRGFYDGFKAGLSRNRNSSFTVTVEGMEGFNAALIFMKVMHDVAKFSRDTLASLQDVIACANDNYSELNRRYTEAFRLHEEMIAELTQKTDEHMAQMSDTSTHFWADCEKRRLELEDLYSEKLKLSEPAEYWEKMEKEYRGKASFWVGMSLLVTVVTIGGLTFLWLSKPDLFSNDSHWMDVFRNSAIITVMVSLAVYILRLFVKLAISSFHLSRDAKERNKLAYFYLALTAKGVVDEKERSIVLNALFSRADTGLLKGDSAPTMPTSVTEIVNKLNN